MDELLPAYAKVLKNWFEEMDVEPSSVESGSGVFNEDKQVHN